MDISRLADLLKNKASSAVEDYSQLANAYPNLKKFAGSLVGNIERNVPTQAELENPNYMQQRALNYMSPMAGAIKAYHGTPHEFERFDMSKIGTGEGAQAYGHGLYFAENPNVAEEYRDALSRKIDVNGKTILNANKTIGSTGDSEIDDYLIAYNGDINKALSEAKNSLSDFVKNAEKGGHYEHYLKQNQDIVDKLQALKDFGSVKTGTHGAIYETSIQWPDPAREASDPLGEHHLLDWDKPLSEQSDYVQNIVEGNPWLKNKLTEKEKWLKEMHQRFASKEIQDDFSKIRPITGESIYTSAQGVKANPFGFTENGPKEASEYLKELGIPGIKYLDQGSRAGGGTSNYVMFGDEYPQIVNRASSLAQLLRGK